MSSPDAWQALIDALRTAVITADDPEADAEGVAAAADRAFALQPAPGGDAALLPLVREAERLHRELAGRLAAWRDHCAADAAGTAVRTRAMDAYGGTADEGAARFLDRSG
jgi:hypothetical protein